MTSAVINLLYREKQHSCDAYIHIYKCKQGSHITQTHEYTDWFRIDIQARQAIIMEVWPV